MNFDDAFNYVHGAEGGYSTDPNDPGNWTGGRPGAGICKGTKYGVSAAAYPDIDIANLTLDQAKAIAKSDYWDKVRGDELPPAIAFGMFDAAYNEGVTGAIKILQTALKVTVDGVLGSETISRVRIWSVPALSRGFAIARIHAYSEDADFVRYENGWVGRVLDIYTRMLQG